MGCTWTDRALYINVIISQNTTQLIMWNVQLRTSYVRFGFFSFSSNMLEVSFTKTKLDFMGWKAIMLFVLGYTRFLFQLPRLSSQYNLKFWSIDLYPLPWHITDQTFISPAIKIFFSLFRFSEDVFYLAKPEVNGHPMRRVTEAVWLQKFSKAERESSKNRIINLDHLMSQ